MAKKKTLEITTDVLSLISNIHFKDITDIIFKKEIVNYYIDLNSLFGGNFVLEDVAYILGMYDDYVIKGTECDAMGPMFTKEAEDYFFALASHISTNLGDIEMLTHYFINKGGLTPGIYEYSLKTGLWSKKCEIHEENSELMRLQKNFH